MTGLKTPPMNALITAVVGETVTLHLAVNSTVSQVSHRKHRHTGTRKYCTLDSADPFVAVAAQVDDDGQEVERACDSRSMAGCYVLNPHDGANMTQREGEGEGKRERERGWGHSFDLCCMS